MSLWSDLLDSETTVISIEQPETTVIALQSGVQAASELHIFRNHLSLDGGSARNVTEGVDPLDGGSASGNTPSI
jgi:hypothetical protein